MDNAISLLGADAVARTHRIAMLAINSLGNADLSPTEREAIKRIARGEVEAFLLENSEAIATSTIDAARSLIASLIQGESKDEATIERLLGAGEEEALAAMEAATEEAAEILQGIANQRALAAQSYAAMTTLAKAAINAGLSAAIGFAPFQIGA